MFPAQTSSVNRVPPDVWRLIFHICTDRDTDLPEAFKSSVRNAPVLLCQVCSGWREIAIRAPELWCNIKFHIDTRGRAYPKYAIIDQALARAGGMPLTVVLSGSNATQKYDPRTPSDAAGTIELLLSSVSRTKHLTIDFRALEQVFFLRDSGGPDGHQQFGKILDDARGAPLLETLTILGHTGFPNFLDANSHIDGTISRLWTPSPRLHTLILLREHLPFGRTLVTRVIPAPYLQLTVFEVNFPMYVIHFLDILSATPNLVQCKALRLLGRLPRQTTEVPVLLTFLKDLDIGGYSMDGVDEGLPLTRFLGEIQTPSLESLHLRGDQAWSRPSFFIFLQNSLCSILHMTLDMDDPGEDHRIQCLEMLPTLKTLIIEQSHPDDHFREKLANGFSKWNASKQEFSICPNLERIEITFDFIFDHSTNKTEFADMVEARFRAGSLKCVSVRDVQEPLSDSPLYAAISCEILRLLILSRDGLTVQLRPQPTWSVLLR